MNYQKAVDFFLTDDVTMWVGLNWREIRIKQMRPSDWLSRQMSLVILLLICSIDKSGPVPTEDM